MPQLMAFWPMWGINVWLILLSAVLEWPFPSPWTIRKAPSLGSTVRK